MGLGNLTYYAMITLHAKVQFAGFAIQLDVKIKSSVQIQSLFHGHYALLSPLLFPRPDYW